MAVAKLKFQQLIKFEQRTIGDENPLTMWVLFVIDEDAYRDDDLIMSLWAPLDMCTEKDLTKLLNKPIILAGIYTKQNGYGKFKPRVLINEKTTNDTD